MSPLPPKKDLKDELVRRLTDELSTLEKAHRATQEAATHPEAKPENDKDTRALEQSYLARGQAQRVEQLRASLAAVSAMPLRSFAEGQPTAVGALVTAEEGDETFAFFICPEGGGEKLAGGRVQVVTPRSPLGKALVGREAGDECEVILAGRTRTLSVLGVE